jgi:hypothetical protein
MEHSGRMRQAGIYLGKCFRLFANEKSWTLFLSAAAIAIIICWVAGDHMFVTFAATRSGSFALVCACIWMGIFNSIQSVCRERGIVKREYRTGLSISAYVAAHLIYEAFICLAEALITVIILFVMRDPPHTGVFLTAWLELFVSFFLIIYAADAMGLLISCLVKDETQAMTVMPFALILQLVLSGVIFSLEDAANTLSYLTISKWGVRALGISANTNRLWGADEQMRAEFLYSTGHLTNTWLILLGFILIFAGLCVFALRSVDKDKR